MSTLLSFVFCSSPINFCAGQRITWPFTSCSLLLPLSIYCSPMWLVPLLEHDPFVEQKTFLSSFAPPLAHFIYWFHLILQFVRPPRRVKKAIHQRKVSRREIRTFPAFIFSRGENESQGFWVKRGLLCAAGLCRTLKTAFIFHRSRCQSRFYPSLVPRRKNTILGTTDFFLSKRKRIAA